MDLLTRIDPSFDTAIMTVAAAVSYRCWWRSPLFLLSLWLFQSQRPADSDGGPAWRICPRCAVPLLHPRGWIIVPKGNYRIFERPRQWRRPLQLLLSVEVYRRIHQKVLLPFVRCAARWLPQQILPAHQRVVVRTGNLHRRILEGFGQILKRVPGV